MIEQKLQQIGFSEHDANNLRYIVYGVDCEGTKSLMCVTEYYSIARIVFLYNIQTKKRYLDFIEIEDIEKGTIIDTCDLNELI